jgi:hypothetical protein
MYYLSSGCAPFVVPLCVRGLACSCVGVEAVRPRGF